MRAPSSSDVSLVARVIQMRDPGDEIEVTFPSVLFLNQPIEVPFEELRNGGS